jgi:hypothetical protein
MSNRTGKIGIGMAGALACVGLLSAGVSVALGSAAYTQGFEQNTNGWDFGTQSSGTYGIKRYKSGSSSPVGTINAASGNYYAVIQNATNNYETGYGDAGYANFGGTSYPGQFTQSVSVYIPTAAWAPPTNSGTPAFWIDSAPSDINGRPIFGGATYNPGTTLPVSMENDFAFFVPSTGNVNVDATDNAALPIATITQSGWYTFATTYYKTGNQTTDPTGETLSAYDSSGNLLGSQSFTYTGDQSQYLGGPNYLWFTAWQNGFAGNALAIDNVSPFVTPIPASFGLVGLGSLALIGGMALRRRLAAKF